MDRDLDEELQYYLDRQIEEGVAAGMERREARQAALRSIAGLTQWKEGCRDMRGLNILDNTAKDLRFGFRQLRKSAGFTATAILVLALGMSASLAIFSFVDAALIRPLPYRDPARLVGAFERTASFPRSNLSVPGLLRLARAQYRLQLVRHLSRRRLHVDRQRRCAARPRCARHGRLLSHAGRNTDSGAGFLSGRRIAVRATRGDHYDSTWQQRYGGRDVIGRAVILDGDPYAIVGVLPGNFILPLSERLNSGRLTTR